MKRNVFKLDYIVDLFLLTFRPNSYLAFPFCNYLTTNNTNLPERCSDMAMPLQIDNFDFIKDL